MTDEQINAAIAEACGWTDCRVIQKATSDGCKSVAYGIPNGYGYDVICPFFATDLNAMHEAEKVLKGYDQIATYVWHLENRAGDWSTDLQLMATHAIARQRAEAFLRTLGKWEEGE